MLRLASPAPADKKHEEVSISVNDIVKPLLLKDLRIQLRARGLRWV